MGKLNRILFLAQMLILIGSITLFYKIGYQLDLENKQATSSVIFYSVKQNYKNILVNAQKILVSWSNESKKLSGNEYCQANSVSSLINDDLYISYGVGDVQGNVICSSRQLPKDFNLSDRTSSYKDVIEHKEIEVTDFGITESTKEPRIALGYPLYDRNDNVLGVLYITLRLKTIESDLKSLIPEKNSQLFITDKDGDILVTNPSNQESVGKKILTPTDLSLLLSQKEGQISVKEEKKNYLYTFSPFGIIENHKDIGYIAYKVERRNGVFEIPETLTLIQLTLVSISIVILSGLFIKNSLNTKRKSKNSK